MTDLVDALEAARLVARGPHPTDRRATLVSLIVQGRATAAWMQAEYGTLARALFADLPEADLVALGRVVDRTLDRLRAESG